MPRRCGTCSACCRWPSVAEIDKPAREPCRFLAKQGFRCTIYADRPKACAEARLTAPKTVDVVRDKSGKVQGAKVTQAGVTTDVSIQ